MKFETQKPKGEKSWNLTKIYLEKIGFWQYLILFWKMRNNHGKFMECDSGLWLETMCEKWPS